MLVSKALRERTLEKRLDSLHNSIQISRKGQVLAGVNRWVPLCLQSNRSSKWHMIRTKDQWYGYSNMTRAIIS